MVAEKEVVRLARSLPITDPFDIEALVDEVARIVGTPVELAPYPERTVTEARRLGESLPAALCVATANRFHVLHRVDTTADHQRHSVLHELGHLLCRHLVVTPDATASDGPADEAQVRAMLRSTYDDDQEHAAEAFAYEFERRLGPVRVSGQRSAEAPGLGEVVDRYTSYLEG
ncbi:hypothetical protein ABTZ99_09395 [Actinosynnema sp. NPDC002837]